MRKVVGRVTRAKVMEEKMVRVDHPPFDVLVVYEEGRFFAIEDACNHAGASLAEGYLESACIICPMHGYKFSLGTGELLAPKGLCDAQRTYQIEEEGDDLVLIDTFEVLIKT
jgi:nitrite reductase/ring-hydroxylating ferredoxin subunit